MSPAWSVTMPGSTVVLTFEPARVERHLDLIHDWMNRTHVVPWWQLDRPAEEIHAYLDGLDHLTPWVVSADGTPFGYVETYRAIEDPLSRYYPATDTDLGWHIVVGPEEVIGSGIPRLMGRAVVASLLNRAERVVCEPDVRNARMLAFCRRLGHTQAAVIDLPEKTAALLTCSRGSFDRLWPDDRAALESTTEVVT